MICIYAIAKIKEGCNQEFLKTAEGLVNYTRAEPGNISYVLCRKSPDTYVFIESWKDEEAVKKHFEMSYFLSAAQKFELLLAEKLEIHQLTAVL